MKTYLKKNWILLGVTLILLITSIVFYSKKVSLEDLIILKYETVPHVKLTNSISFDETGKASGEISGFVVFKNQEDQPRDLRQYHIIKPLDLYDDNSRQIFIYDDIIKIGSLSPRSIGETLLFITNDTRTYTALEDKHGNSFKINKITKAVSMFDTTGDSTYLITSDSDYQDFIRAFLKKKK